MIPKNGLELDLGSSFVEDDYFCMRRKVTPRFTRVDRLSPYSYSPLSRLEKLEGEGRFQLHIYVLYIRTLAVLKVNPVKSTHAKVIY